MELELTVNGARRVLTCGPGATLLEVLRAAGYKSVKQGCDCEGTCGTCTVLVDGVPLLACITPAPRLEGREVLTVEGLGDPSRPHAVQLAFVEAGAVQCGFCTPGMVLAAKALLDRERAPTSAQIADALSSNLCRCTGYVKIADAVRLAAARLAAARTEAGGLTAPTRRRGRAPPDTPAGRPGAGPARPRRRRR